MQKFKKSKQILFLMGLMFASVCMANNLGIADGNGIIIKKSGTQNTPRDISIQASINGHSLDFFINENIGQVTIEVSSSTGSTVYYSTTSTPDSEHIYISDTGNYILTLTLSNGDEYYGEFTVTN